MQTVRSLKLSLTASALFLVSACSMFNGSSSDKMVMGAEKNNFTASTMQSSGEPICLSAMGLVIDCRRVTATQGVDEEAMDMTAMADTHPLVASNNSVLVGEYVEQMATNMLESLSVPVREVTVGVTSFVEFTDKLSSINQLGNILAESFIFELQQNGIPVVDYKVASQIHVKPDGDFIFSRNPAALNLTDTMQYVLTGTIMYNKRGLVVNARMVHFESKRVVASSKQVIPYFVLDSMIPVSEKHTVFGS